MFPDLESNDKSFSAALVLWEGYRKAAQSINGPDSDSGPESEKELAPEQDHQMPTE